MVMHVTPPGASASSPIGSSDQSPITWKPGATSHANVYGSWAEVMTAINGRENVRIYVDTSLGLAVIPDGTWEMLGAEFWGADEYPYNSCSPYDYGYRAATLISIGPAAVLNELSGIHQNIELRWGPFPGTPEHACLTFTNSNFSYGPDPFEYPTAGFVIGEGCTVTNSTNRAMIDVIAATDSVGFTVKFMGSQPGVYGAEGLYGSLIHAEGYADDFNEYEASIFVICRQCFEPGVNWIWSSFGLETIRYASMDDGSNISLLPNFAGFEYELCWTANAFAVKYDDALAPPFLGASTVQEAIDALKAGSGGGIPNIPITRVMPTTPGESIPAAVGITSVDLYYGWCNIVLPPTPTTGDSYWVKDLFGKSAGNPIQVVSSGGHYFDGQPGPYTIDVDYDARQFVFDGGQWNVL